MLIIKITANGKITYHGCIEIEIDILNSIGGRRVKMKSAFGLKRIKDIVSGDTVEIITDIVFL